MDSPTMDPLVAELREAAEEMRCIPGGLGYFISLLESAASRLEATAAAVALAEAAADLWRGDAVNPWETRHSRRQAFDAALDAYRAAREEPDHA